MQVWCLKKAWQVGTQERETRETLDVLGKPTKFRRLKCVQSFNLQTYDTTRINTCYKCYNLQLLMPSVLDVLMRLAFSISATHISLSCMLVAYITRWELRIPR